MCVYMYIYIYIYIERERHLECLLDDTCFLLRIGLGRVIRLLGVRLQYRLD